MYTMFIFLPFTEDTSTYRRKIKPLMKYYVSWHYSSLNYLFPLLFICSFLLFYFQTIIETIQGRQKDVDAISDEAQTLQQLTGESRVGGHVTQLASRYQSLLSTSKVT